MGGMGGLTTGHAGDGFLSVVNSQCGPVISFSVPDLVPLTEHPQVLELSGVTTRCELQYDFDFEVIFSSYPHFPYAQRQEAVVWFPAVVQSEDVTVSCSHPPDSPKPSAPIVPDKLYLFLPEIADVHTAVRVLCSPAELHPPFVRAVMTQEVLVVVTPDPVW